MIFKLLHGSKMIIGNLISNSLNLRVKIVLPADYADISADLRRLISYLSLSFSIEPDLRFYLRPSALSVGNRRNIEQGLRNLCFLKLLHGSKMIIGNLISNSLNLRVKIVLPADYADNSADIRRLISDLSVFSQICVFICVIYDIYGHKD